MQQLTTGTLLQGGRYKIERALGQGGFGITYLAIQSGLDRKVAVKEFFMKNLCDRNEETSKITFGTEGSREMVRRFKEKFLKEARNIAKFNHPNIVRVIDVFEENDTAYYVMDYAEGGSLADKVNKEGFLSEADATRYIRQVAEALDYIHQRKVNHLDVKPANIMLNEEDNAILIDFGLSKQYDAATGNQTSTTPVGISDGYAPMEQYTGVSEFSPETDVYSLAATFFKLLTGKTPPSASVIYDEGVPVGELEANSVSQTSIDAICNAMKGRKARTQSISEFVNSLPKKGTRKRTTTKKTSTTKAASKTAESKKTAKVKSEDTEYIGNTTTTTKEETEIISQSVAEAPQKKEKIKEKAKPNFDETKYEIPRTYKNFPIISERKSNEGDVEASLALAMMYLRGEGVRQNLDAAYQWIKKLESQGDYRANILLSQWDSLKSKYEVKHQPEDNNRDDGEEVENNNSGTWKFLMGVVVAIGLIIVGFWQYFAYQEREKLRFEEEMEQSLNAIYYEDNILYVKGIQYEMIPVKGGTFMKGSHTENADIPEIVKETSVNDFSIGATEITEQIWYAVMDCSLDSIEGEFPMANISWEDCQLFIKKLNEVTNMNFRLPTEAEWEFAARGGTKSKDYLYSGSDNIDDVAWYGKNAKGLYWVAQKKPNELGLYDMSGNLYEYTSDLFYWNSNSKKNIYIPEDGTQIVIKGGCYNAVYDFICLPGYRMFSKKDSRLEDVGFRIAL